MPLPKKCRRPKKKKKNIIISRKLKPLLHRCAFNAVFIANIYGIEIYHVDSRKYTFKNDRCLIDLTAFKCLDIHFIISPFKVSENALKLNDTAYISISWYAPPGGRLDGCTQPLFEIFYFYFFCIGIVVY